MYLLCHLDLKTLYSFVGGDIDCFYFLAILNNAAVNMAVQICLRDLVFSSVEYIPRSEIDGSYGSSIFNFFEELPYCFL